MWVPLVENNEHESDGADYFIKKDIDSLLAAAPGIDTVLLACTHYPLLKDKIRQFLPQHIQLVTQGEIVAASLSEYLQRHPEMEERISRNGNIRFFTTDSNTDFDSHASVFFGQPVQSTHLDLQEK